MKLLRAAIFVLCIGIVVNPSHGQGYVIGVDDLISIQFWQDPTLNITVKVGEDGTILLPVGGSVQAAGTTPEQLSIRIVDTISLFYRDITSAAVSVVEYGSRKVYVMGQVIHPGKYMFETIPDLWKIISEAGGATDLANLNNVIIIRDKAGEEQSLSVDLASILRNNEFDRLPKILPGDNIYVPAVVGTVAGSGINAVQAQQKVLFIYGQVGSPGVYTFNEQLSLLEALVTAGGPTETAKLNVVRVIRKTGAYSSVIEIDVERYSRESVPQLFMVQAGDVIYVPRKKIFKESTVWSFGNMVITVAMTALVYDLIMRRD